MRFGWAKVFINGVWMCISPAAKLISKSRVSWVMWRVRQETCCKSCNSWWTANTVTPSFTFKTQLLWSKLQIKTNNAKFQSNLCFAEFLEWGFVWKAGRNVLVLNSTSVSCIYFIWRSAKKMNKNLTYTT